MALFAKWLVSAIGSTTTPIKSSVANAKFMGFYTSNSATSGVSVGIYMRLNSTGVGGGSCAGRFYAETQVAASGGSGIQATFGTGESTTAGSVSGLGTGVYAQVGFANNTITGGTFAAINCEVYTWGSSSVITATRTSFIRFSNNGSAKSGIDSNALFFDLQGFTSGASSLYYWKGSAMSGALDGCLKIAIPDNGGVAYIPLLNNAT